MAMFKATPRGILNGVRDLSKRAPVPTVELVPTHLPLVPILAERGDEEPRLVSGDAAVQLYGAETFDLRSIYATHQTVLANIISARGNAIMVKRMRPANAATAFLRISLEVIRHRLPKYNRNADGTFQTNASGNYIPETDDGTPTGTPTGATVEGFRLVWHTSRTPYGMVGPINTALFGEGRSIDAFRSGAIVPPGGSGETLSAYDGVTIGTAAAVSTLYPIMDLEVASFGKYGDNCGLRLDAPHAQSAQPGNDVLMESVKAFLYRISCVERETASSTPDIVTTLSGDTSQDLALRGEVFDVYGRDISFDTAFVGSYRQLSSDGVVPSLGVFNRLRVYDAYLNTVLALLQNGSAAAGDVLLAPGEGSFDTDAGRMSDGLLGGYPDRAHLINIFTGVDPQGRPYTSIDVHNSVRMGGVAFGPTAVHYATGGADGLANTGNPTADRLANLMTYDNLVRADAKKWGKQGTDLAHYMDDARYPFSHIWDSGFSVDTKIALLEIMGRRPDVAVRLATQAVADYTNPADPLTWGYKAQNTASEEVAIGSLLRTAIGLYPESVVFGTPACRASVFGHAGHVLNSPWRGLVPMTLDMADKYAKAFGAANGIWSSSDMPDLPENNIVTLFESRDVNLTWKDTTGYNTNWDLGINFVRYFDMNRLFYPAYQTAYPDDTSVLNDDITVNVVIELEKICQRTWRRLTGRQLPNDVFVDESNRIIREQVANRFADRFTVIPNTYLTGGDIERGFSWSCEIDLYGAKAKTVGSFTINSRRIEDLQAA